MDGKEVEAKTFSIRTAVRPAGKPEPEPVPKEEPTETRRTDQPSSADLLRNSNIKPNNKEKNRKF